MKFALLGLKFVQVHVLNLTSQAVQVLLVDTSTVAGCKCNNPCERTRTVLDWASQLL